MATQQTFTIFLVDDDPFFLALLNKQLVNSGYNKIRTFSNGADCLNALNEKPDVIFLDHNMDTLSGYEVLKKIKRYDPDIFVVMVSGQEDIKTAVDSLKHGAFDYILKSDNEMEKIVTVLDKVAHLQELKAKKKPGILKSIFSIV